jgi:acetyltransferase-like isoleucine patch superfamily enzyme
MTAKDIAQSDLPTTTPRPTSGLMATPASTATMQPIVGGRASWYRQIATSQKPLPRFLRAVRRSIFGFSLPAPRFLVRPALWLFLFVRGAYYFFLRVLICEPLFKAYCKKYGTNLRTGCFVHWIMGRGDIVIGDNVILDGECKILFAARFSDCPVLEIGDNTAIGHDCRLVIGKRISIGRDCTLSGGTIIMDSNGHPADANARIAHQPPNADEVRPVTIGDGVWIGMQCIIFPGVRIGSGSVISAGSVVRTHVPPYSVVAGNPAKVMFRLKKPDAAAPTQAGGPSL